MEYDLGIRAGGKPMSLAAQLFPEFQVVEDFPVERDPERRVLVAHGLLAAGKIDDAEPGVRQPHTVLAVKSSIVRAAMRKHPDHPLKGFRSDGRSIYIEHARDATHIDLILGKASAKNSISEASCSKSHSLASYRKEANLTLSPRLAS